MIVKDKGSPVKSDTTTIKVNVERNLNAPKFVKGTYNITVPENRPKNSEIATVSATDDDGVSYTYISQSPYTRVYNVDLLHSHIG